jgi:hypothetical protein
VHTSKPGSWWWKLGSQVGITIGSCCKELSSDNQTSARGISLCPDRKWQLQHSTTRHISVAWLACHTVCTCIFTQNISGLQLQ